MQQSDLGTQRSAASVSCLQLCCHYRKKFQGSRICFQEWVLISMNEGQPTFLSKDKVNGDG